MTQREEGVAGGPVASGTPTSLPTAGDSSAWAPLGQWAFRSLWIGMLLSYVGTWMQMVGGQWLLVDEPNAATWVSLVQVATTLPVMLLAFPAGVVADAFDRRWLLWWVQVYFFVVGILLAALTAADQMPPALLLAFTFAIGAGAAMQLPAWGAIIPETVPKAQLPAATRLEVVGVNLARAAGPALAGVVIARAGVAEVFFVNAASVVVLAIVLLRWRRPPAGVEGRRERFVPALRAGGRYVWHEPVVRRILLRAALFITPAMALWSLLPLIASQGLGLGADGYGALFGALGVGAIVAFLALGKVRERLSNNALLGVAHIAYAAALATVVVAPNVVVALASLVLAGLAWAAMISTLNAELQFFLPQWVRARGLAVHLVTFMGSQAVGALLWGLVAQGFGLRAACFIAGAVMLAGAVAGWRWPVAETGHLDREPAAYWGEARLAFEPEPDAGPILVTVEFIVAPERQAAFLEAMEHLRRSRLQTGATRWELFRDGERPTRFVELFSVPSWEEHLRQHDGRLTATDRQIEEAALAFSDPPPRAEHLVPP